MLNYYKFEPNDKRNLINAYNKYWNARTNTRASNARRNARLAGTKFSNAVFRMYNKQVSNKSAVSNGLQNGVYRSMIYWLPGILVRQTFRRPASI
jgi:cyanate permease